MPEQKLIRKHPSPPASPPIPVMVAMVLLGNISPATEYMLAGLEVADHGGHQLVVARIQVIDDGLGQFVVAGQHVEELRHGLDRKSVV